MKALRTLLGLALACVGFVASSLIFYCAWQIRTVSKVARPEPQQLSAGDLIANGPGDNLHVDVTDFEFGKPIIDENNDQWTRVWIPISAPTKGKNKKPAVENLVFFCTTRIRNQDQLDEFLQSQTVNAIVGSTSLKKTYWGSGVSANLYLAYPKMDIDKVTILTEPAMVIPETRIVLKPDLLMNPVNANIAFGAAAGLLLLGLLGSYLLASHEQKTTIDEVICRVDRRESGRGVTTRYISAIPSIVVNPAEAQRQRELAVHEPEQSIHEFMASSFIRSACVAAVALVFMLVMLAQLLATVASATKHSGPLVAAGLGLFALVAFTGIMYVVAWNLDVYRHRTSRIQVCTSGLRWLRGKTPYVASWLEIAYVERVAVDTNFVRSAAGAQFGMIGALAVAVADADHASLKRTSDTLTLILRTGERLFFSMENLTEYRWFADSVHQWHGMEAKRFSTSNQFDAIGRAVVLPGRSNQTMLKYGR